MAGATAIWGIDLGRCSLKAIKLRPGADGKVDIVGQELIEHAKMLSQPDTDRHEVVSSAIEKFLARNDISKDKVVVGVPGQHTLARFSKLPPVEPKKIPDIVRYEADQQIPFDLDEVIWDFQTFQEEDSPDVEVGIFAMKRELIRDYLLPFERAGIEPIVVQSSPLALYNALHFEGRLTEEASVLLDLGAENTDLIVATNHNLWTRTVPLGGNKFTDVLVKAFKLTFSKAENLKRTAATSKYARQIFQAMRPVFAELVQELSRSLGFYRSTHRDTELVRILGLGNAFELPGLQKYLQQNLQLPVERPMTFTNANVVDVRDTENFKENMSPYIVAYGLALQGLEHTKSQPGTSAISSNLLPGEIVKQVVWRKKKPFFAASAACLLLASGIVWFRQSSDMGTLQANAGNTPPPVNLDRATQILQTGVTGGLRPREEANTILQVSKTFGKELSTFKTQGLDEKKKCEQLIQLQRNKAVWPKILASIHAALPKTSDKVSDVTDVDSYINAVTTDRSGVLRRERREEVFIERFESTYHAEIDEVEMEDMVLKADAPQVIKPKGNAKRPGFHVKLECRTPHEETIRFAADKFRDALLETGRQPGTGFFINRVVFASGRKLPQKGKKSGASTSTTRGGWGKGRGGRGKKPTTPTPKSSDAKFVDPVTDEAMDNDWVFGLELDVVLEDLPVEEKKDDPAGNTTTGNP